MVFVVSDAAAVRRPWAEARATLMPLRLVLQLVGLLCRTETSTTYLAPALPASGCHLHVRGRASIRWWPGERSMCALGLIVKREAAQLL